MIGFALVTITAPVVGVIAGGRFAFYEGYYDLKQINAAFSLS